VGDKTMVCVGCGRKFTWTTGEQRFYAQRKLEPPKRCADCRERHRATAAAWWNRADVRYGALVLGATIAATGWLWLAISLDVVLAWLVAITLVTLLIYGLDKSIAGSGRTRVPERVLLGMALAGGTLGALAGMLAFRHKTIKESFRVKFGLVMLAQAALVAVYYFLKS